MKSFYKPYQDHLSGLDKAYQDHPCLEACYSAAEELGCFWLVALAPPGLPSGFWIFENLRRHRSLLELSVYPNSPCLTGNTLSPFFCFFWFSVDKVV